MGTMFARREGADPRSTRLHGSHLDTQPTGGKYDGVLGVLGGLEVLRTLNDAGIRTRRPIVLANWTNEEGTRFAPAMLASGVFAGIHTQDYAYGRTDAEGSASATSSAHRLRGRGARGRAQIHSMFELHIEQGPILEAEARRSASSPTPGPVVARGRFRARGAYRLHAHAMRVNAGLGMARIVEMVHRVAMDHQPDAVGAVGHMNVWPNSRNVIPGRAVFTIDIRSPEQGKLDSMRARIEAEAPRIAAGAGPRHRDRGVGHFDPVTFDPASQTASGGRPTPWATPAATSSRARARRLLDRPRGAHGDDHVPLQGRPEPQRGRGDHPRLGAQGTDVLLHAVLEAAEGRHMKRGNRHARAGGASRLLPASARLCSERRPEPQ
jgi:N-carbamoyl-L-amino-acid hydrolase